ncbi:recombination protein RecR [Sneathiella sp. P13V-1]|uniref:recombination mediator RecR n=1 Tax=Sneathiella sp. P13V-1 TaxID=2697366 RepID=UPI00187B5A4C|nr:recombination mediator RecR [Sneathiella sp. P13V-1]MBE7635430.1 recombination protein RecR [Sneathiella sp. P13V-1]
MANSEIDQLVQLMSKIPGLGARSARRAALHLIKNRETLLVPLGNAMSSAAEHVKSCSVCGNLDTSDPCAICLDGSRDITTICVVEDVSDLWALERAGAFNGQYHVLGGTLSPLDGVGPEELRVEELLERVQADNVQEVIIALNATVDGQTTAHYLTDRLEENPAKVSHLAHGVPVGGELDYLDDGTLATALKSRRSLT